MYDRRIISHAVKTIPIAGKYFNNHLIKLISKASVVKKLDTSADDTKNDPITANNSEAGNQTSIRGGVVEEEDKDVLLPIDLDTIENIKAMSCFLQPPPSSSSSSDQDHPNSSRHVKDMAFSYNHPNGGPTTTSITSLIVPGHVRESSGAECLFEMDEDGETIISSILSSIKEVNNINIPDTFIIVSFYLLSFLLSPLHSLFRSALLIFVLV